MVKTTSFEGIRVSLKLDTQTHRTARRTAGQNAIEPVLRQWIYNWRSLANLSPFLYERLVRAAQDRRLELGALVNEALTLYCAKLPEVPSGESVLTPMTVVEVAPAPASAPAVDVRAKPSEGRHALTRKAG